MEVYALWMKIQACGFAKELNYLLKRRGQFLALRQGLDCVWVIPTIHLRSNQNTRRLSTGIWNRGRVEEVVISLHRA